MGRADSVLRVPPENLECVSLADADYSLLATETQRVNLINVSLADFLQPPTGICRNVRNGNGMTSLSPVIGPRHRLNRTDVLNNQGANVITGRLVPSKWACPIERLEEPPRGSVLGALRTASNGLLLRRRLVLCLGLLSAKTHGGKSKAAVILGHSGVGNFGGTALAFRESRPSFKPWIFPMGQITKPLRSPVTVET